MDDTSPAVRGKMVELYRTLAPERNDVDLVADLRPEHTDALLAELALLRAERGDGS